MHYPINIEMLMGMAQTAGISDLSKKLLGQMARALNNIYKMGMEYSTEDFVFTPEIVREAHQRVYGKLLTNEEADQQFYELLSEWGNDIQYIYFQKKFRFKANKKEDGTG